MSKTYGEALNEARSLLRSREITEADNDAWLLMSEVSGFSRIDFWEKGRVEMPDDKLDLYMNYVTRRAEHVPLQYIIGYQDFCGLRFDVDRNVLIPRQDTEVLVEKLIPLAKGKRVLDMCTGSGCIIISLAKLAELSEGLGVDISEEALAVARHNAILNKVAKNPEKLFNRGEDKVSFLKSNLFEQVEGSFDVIVSNPPYIESEVIDTLMEEVKDFEPRLALDGDTDGLKFYRIIANEARNHLTDGGLLAFEIGCEQAKSVSDICRDNGYTDIAVFKDLAGLDRVLFCRYKKHL